MFYREPLNNSDKFRVGDFVKMVKIKERVEGYVYALNAFMCNDYYGCRGVIERIELNPHIAGCYWHYLIIGEKCPGCEFFTDQLELLYRPSIEELLTSSNRFLRKGGLRIKEAESA